jgi:hypothetical protein
VIGLVVPLAVTPPGEDVTMYPVIGAPPFDTGGVNLTTADRGPAAAVPIRGAPGAVAGVTARDGVDGAPVPAVLVAVTVKV